MHTPDPIIAAFYNVENLFDTINDPIKKDDDFLPGSPLKWSDTRYAEKLKNIAESISSIHPGKLPAIIGIAEVETNLVLRDLIAQNAFLGRFDFIHFESPDRRGIDVALVFDKHHFEVQSKERIPVHIFVNHWSSRKERPQITVPRCIAAADQLYNKAMVNLGIMAGEGIKIKSPRLTIHCDKKLLFYDKERSIYRPNRTYSEKRYRGGFSDHLPVYVHMNID